MNTIFIKQLFNTVYRLWNSLWEHKKAVFNQLLYIWCIQFYLEVLLKKDQLENQHDLSFFLLFCWIEEYLPYRTSTVKDSKKIEVQCSLCSFVPVKEFYIVPEKLPVRSTEVKKCMLKRKMTVIAEFQASFWMTIFYMPKKRFARYLHIYFIF